MSGELAEESSVILQLQFRGVPATAAWVKVVHSKYVAVTTSLLARPYGQQGHPRMRISQELFKQKLSNKFLSLTIFTQNMWTILLNSLELVFIEYFQF